MVNSKDRIQYKLIANGYIIKDIMTEITYNK